MIDLHLIDPTISQLNETVLANILLYGDSKKTTSENSKILQSTIRYIFATKRFITDVDISSRANIFNLK